ncbi:CoA transferase, partial [Nonomuraea sp. NPDC004297]
MEENGRGDRLRVLDLTDELAFQGARLLVGLGADVVRVERPADAELPRADDLHWHAGKRLVRLPEGGAGEARLDELAAQADVVIESGPRGGLRGLTVTGEEPRSRWEGNVHAVVTPFGLTGPWRDREAGDLVAAAAGGMAWLGGKPGLPPKAPPREQAAQLAGAHLAIAALLGVIARDRTGRGQLIDVSAQEAVAATLETAAIAWIHAGRHPSRNGGVYEHVAHRVFAAADGHVAGGYSGSDRMWTDLLAWMAEHGEAADLTDAKWADPVLRWQGREHVDRIVAGFAARRTRTELAREGRRRALPWAEVSTAARLTANEQLAARDFFTRVHGPDLPEEGVLDVGFPFPAPGLPRPVRLSAPDRADPAAPWRTGSPRGP